MREEIVSSQGHERIRVNAFDPRCSPHDAAELVREPLAVTHIQRKTTVGGGIHGAGLRRPQRGMRRWRCGSEDDQHEDLKPQYGGADRHEP